jgi:heat shock protein HslJ
MVWLLWHLWLYGLSGFVDESLSGYAARDAPYQLFELNGRPAEHPIAVVFPSMWRMEWRTGCGVYRAKISVPYPWFGLVAVTAVPRACAEASADRAFIAALHAMTLSEVHGGTLILSDGAGAEMVFRTK